MQRWQGQSRSCSADCSPLYSVGPFIYLQEYALFEPGCRHVAKDIMGTNRANPSAMILSATMMLRHLGYASSSNRGVLHRTECHGDFSLDHLANSVASATFDVINAGKVRTADMGGKLHFPDYAGSSVPHDVFVTGSATTSEFTAAVIKNLN